MLFTNKIDFLKLFFKKVLNLFKNKDVAITFNLSFVLLPINVDNFIKKYNYKKNAFVVFDFGNYKLIFLLLEEIIIFYI